MGSLWSWFPKKNIMRHRTKILAIDDNEEVLTLYQDLFKIADAKQRHFQLKCIDDPTSLEEEIKSFNPKILILDVNMGNFSGIEICRKLRKESSRESNYLGIICVSSDPALETLIRCLDAGADDFCLKSQTAQELLARINSVRRIIRMAESLQSYIRRLKLVKERLEQITITDDLSGLYNMRYFKARLREEFTRAKRYSHPVSILMFDIDHFKQVNDRCDHLLGSHVLAELGPLVLRNIRSNDLAARYGGDEYIIMMPETDLDGAVTCAEKLRKVIAAHHFDNGKHQTQITISIGVAAFDPKESAQCENSIELIRLADERLYDAKEQGRNRVVA